MCNGKADRSDFYLENGKLEKLPKNLNNYHTSYFHKLEKIQDFCNGNINYEDIKDNLPNNIRIVLEAFLSFKFGRQKGKKFPSPSLEELTNHLSSYDFKSFAPIGNIKYQQSLKETLYQICKIVNPESHGTPQDLLHLSTYLSELRDVAEKTLDVIWFLDQIHFKAVKELMNITT